MEQVQITLNLFNRPFKLKVQPAAEEQLRKVVKQLNENIDDYKKSYPGRDDFEYLAMSVMSYVSSLAPVEKDTKTISTDILESLFKIENILDK